MGAECPVSRAWWGGGGRASPPVGLPLQPGVLGGAVSTVQMLFSDELSRMSLGMRNKTGVPSGVRLLCSAFLFCRTRASEHLFFLFKNLF